MGLRKERMADEIRDILARNFQGGELNDPRLASVTITAVKLSADLQQAMVYFRTYSDGDSKQAQRGLEAAAGRFRRQLGQALDVRRVPELRFVYDTSLEYASRIETLLHKIADEDKGDS
jgi:ribosome-binding factor A